MSQNLMTQKSFQSVILIDNPSRFQNNQLLVSVMRQLLKLLIYEFQNHSYDGNRILRVVFQKVKTDSQSKQKENVIQLWPDVELLIWNLSISPKYWIVMFEHQQFFSAEKQCVDMHVFTNKIYKFVLQQAQKLTLLAQFLSGLVSAQIFSFLEEVSEQICNQYQRGRQIILVHTKNVEQLVQNSPIINFYLLYKLLMEISAYCQQKIIEEISSNIFRNIEMNYCKSFARYILEKHEILNLKYDSKSKQLQEPLIQIMERIKREDNLKWREAVRQDGQSALIVQFQEKEGTNNNYMIKMNKNGEMEVKNCNTLRMKWMVGETAQKNFDILNIVSSKNALAQKLRGSPLKTKDITLTDHFSTVGGALGKCLADIQQYESVGDFMFDLSKKSFINGTFNYLATNIPLIGIMFASGGYTYSLYSIFSNKNVNKKKKFQELGFMTVDTASSIGSGIIGATIGQSVIPIPFLGAFVGGFIGGFIGQLGGKALTNKLQTIRFKQIISLLQEKLQPGGYWQVNSKTLSIVGLNRQNFYNTIPVQIEQRLGADKFWFAMIGFTILCFHESQKRANFLQKKMKAMKKQNKNKYSESVAFEEIKKDLSYNPSLDIICIMKYFEQNKIDLLTCYKQIQQFIGEVFARIK